tara:strand:+ start:172 stop:816 length:645 start_codon:yes stop_codon:yes gene_type:complete
MKINIVSSKQSWINPYLKKFSNYLKRRKMNVKILYTHNHIKKSDISFFLSYWDVVPERILKLSKFNLVVHESNLPKGRGWSPITWQILKGKKKIVICLIEATKKIDSGDIYLKKEIFFKGNELIDEIREKQVKVTLSLCKNFLVKYKNRAIKKKRQKGASSYYFRRSPKDSLLQLNKTIKQNFNLLRIVDNKKYPAFFYFKNNKYIIHIYKEKK